MTLLDYGIAWPSDKHFKFKNPPIPKGGKLESGIILIHFMELFMIVVIDLIHCIKKYSFQEFLETSRLEKKYLGVKQRQR